MSLYHDARIIHDPIRQSYEVQFKKHMWSFWKHAAVYGYQTVYGYQKEQLGNGYVTLQAVALKWARDQVESIKAQEVVK